MNANMTKMNKEELAVWQLLEEKGRIACMTQQKIAQAIPWLGLHEKDRSDMPQETTLRKDEKRFTVLRQRKVVE